MKLKNSVAILGLGKSGNSAFNYFKKNAEKLGITKIFAWDDKPEIRDTHPDILCIEPKKWDWKDLQFVIFSPGIPTDLPEPHPTAVLAKNNNVPITCDIEILWRDKNPNSEIVAITGTNGKSTTTALIHHILKENNIKTLIGGNFGIPALSLDLEGEYKYVIEVSSFQLDLLKDAKFNLSVFLNLTPDHMERYATIENYANSKKRIFKNQTESDNGIICIDTEIMQKIYNQCRSDFRSNFITFKTGEKLIKGTFHNLPGFHNLQNITAAFLACKELGIPEEKIIASIKTFKGLEHRIENVFENQAVKFINDSKATNADATEPALKTFSNIYWLAGGVPKSGGIEPLKPFFGKIKQAYFFGEARFDFAETYSKASFSNFKIFDSFYEAFAKSAEDASSNGRSHNIQNVVLLSPACASFDEFKNYEERGKIFSDLSKKFGELK